MTNDLITARAQLTALNAETTELQIRRADLLAELETVDRQLHDAAARAEPLASRVRLLKAEPEAKRQLEMLTQTLTTKLSQARQDSPTVRAIKLSLPNLADEASLASSRLALVRRLLDDLKNAPRLDADLWGSPRVAGREGR